VGKDTLYHPSLFFSSNVIISPTVPLIYSGLSCETVLITRAYLAVFFSSATYADMRLFISIPCTVEMVISFSKEAGETFSTSSLIFDVVKTHLVI
jgi:hypothetical protein